MLLFILWECILYWASGHNVVGLLKVSDRESQNSTRGNMCLQYLLENARHADSVNLIKATRVKFWDWKGEVWCTVISRHASQLKESLFITIVLFQVSVSIPWCILDVLSKLAQLHHLKKYAFWVVDYLQVKFQAMLQHPNGPRLLSFTHAECFFCLFKSESSMSKKMWAHIFMSAYLCDWGCNSLSRASVFLNQDYILGLGAAWNVADISKGSTVVIFGLGTVGLSVCIGIIMKIHLYIFKPFAFSYFLGQIWTNNLSGCTRCKSQRSV